MKIHIDEIQTLIDEWKIQIASYEDENNHIDTKLDSILSKVGYHKDRLSTSNLLEAETCVRTMASNNRHIIDLSKKYTHFDIGRDLLQNRYDAIRNSKLMSSVASIIQKTNNIVNYERWKKDSYFIADELQAVKHNNSILDHVIKGNQHQKKQDENDTSLLLDQYIEARPNALMEILSPAPPKSPLQMSYNKPKPKFEIESNSIPRVIDLASSDDEHSHEYENAKQMFVNAKQKLLEPPQENMSDTITSKINHMAAL